MKNYKFLNLLFMGGLIVLFLILSNSKSYLFQTYSFIRGSEINELSRLFIENYLWSLFLGSIITFIILLNFNQLKIFFNRYIVNLNNKKLFLIILIFNLILSFSFVFFIDENSLTSDAAHYMSVAKSLYNGEGYISRTVLFMGIRPESIPYPDIFKPPLFSTVLAISYFIFGINYFAAKIVNLFLVSFIAPLTFLLALKLSQSKRFALFTSALITFDWILIKFRGLILSDITYLIFTLLFFILMFKARKKYHYALLGVIIGLAYLTRYQGFYLLFPTLLVYEYIKDKNIKRIILNLLITFLVFLAIASPWLIRNHIEYGSPTYCFMIYQTGHTYKNNYHYYHPLGDSGYYTASLEKPKTAFEVILNTPMKMVNKMMLNLKYSLYITPFFVMNNPFLFLLFLVGCFILFKRKLFYPLMLYIVLSYLFYSMAHPATRFFYSLIPFFAIIISFGFMGLYSKLNNKKLVQSVLVSLIILILSTNLFFGVFSFVVQSKKYEVYIPFTKKISDDIIKTIEDNESVMVNYAPPVYGYFSNKNIVQFPYYKNEEEFFDVIKDYNVKYIIYYDRYKPRIPHLIPETNLIKESSYSIKGGEVFEVDLDAISKNSQELVK